MTTRRPTTPLRRVSRGSLSALSQSLRAGASTGPASSSAHDTPLFFLEGALADLSDDASVLHSNLEQVNAIHDALGTFNENFAMYLYGLKMNAFCVEWPEAPSEDNFQRAAEREARLSEQATKQAQYSSNLATGGRFSSGGYGDETVAAEGGGGSGGGINVADQTYMTADDDADAPPTPKPKLKPALKKPSAGPSVAAWRSASQTGTAVKAAPAASASKGKMSVALRKKREAFADGVIATLPLEYRGNDPKPRAMAESVIMALLAAGPKGVRVAEIAKNPEMPQVKVNKTLIALVAAKHVVKSSNNGIVYNLDPSRHPDLP